LLTCAPGLKGDVTHRRNLNWSAGSPDPEWPARSRRSPSLRYAPGRPDQGALGRAARNPPPIEDNRGCIRGRWRGSTRRILSTGYICHTARRVAVGGPGHGAEQKAATPKGARHALRRRPPKISPFGRRPATDRPSAGNAQRPVLLRLLIGVTSGWVRMHKKRDTTEFGEQRLLLEPIAQLLRHGR